MERNESTFGVILRGLGAVRNGFGKVYGFFQKSPAINNAANLGRAELAASLYNGNAFVMYGDKQHLETKTPSNEVKNPMISLNAESQKQFDEMKEQEMTRGDDFEMER